MSYFRVKTSGYKRDGWELVVVSPWMKKTVLHRRWKWYLKLLGFFVEAFTNNQTYIRPVWRKK